MPEPLPLDPEPLEPELPPDDPEPDDPEPDEPLPLCDELPPDDEAEPLPLSDDPELLCELLCELLALDDEPVHGGNASGVQSGFGHPSQMFRTPISTSRYTTCRYVTPGSEIVTQKVSPGS